MKRIFLEEALAENVTITGKAANHLANSLRARRGERIIAVDKFGNTATLEFVDFAQDKIFAKCVSEITKVSTAKKITLADCLPKQNKFDAIVEKATELGVEKIVPLISDRTIARPGNFRAKNKLERWKRIAQEAAEQCARDTLPEIGEICELADWLNEIAPNLGHFVNGKFDGQGALLLFCYEKETADNLAEVLREYKNCACAKEIIILIGPEGGFAEREVREIKSCGGVSVSLGKTVLKTDTAAICALAVVNYEID